MKLPFPFEKIATYPIRQTLNKLIRFALILSKD